MSEKKEPDQLDVLESMIDEEIRQINSDINRKQAQIAALEWCKNNIEAVRQRFDPSYQTLFGGTPK